MKTLLITLIMGIAVIGSKAQNANSTPNNADKKNNAGEPIQPAKGMSLLPLTGLAKGASLVPVTNWTNGNAGEHIQPAKGMSLLPIREEKKPGNGKKE